MVNISFPPTISESALVETFTVFQSSLTSVLYFIEYLISAIALAIFVEPSATLLKMATNPPGMLLFMRSVLSSSTFPSAMPYNDLARLSAATKAVFPLDNFTI